ncbi:MAG: diguanylate cyclase [Parafilimonas terrae]|nr:diguanylate cyclase [Parafilimonas terrae]
MSHLAHSLRMLALLGLVLIGGLWAYTGWSIADLRQRAWERTRHDAVALREAGERAVARDIEIYDLSLRTVAERLNAPILEEVNPEARHLALFDRMSHARGYGSIFVLDQNGRAFLDAGSVIPRPLDASGRPFFTVHRDNPHAGLVIGHPWMSRISQSETIPLSRRFSYADGSFAGVVVGAIHLDYLREILDRLRGDADVTVTLEFSDGNVVTSGLHPADATEPKVAGFVTTGQVGAWPLRIAISVPAPIIRRAWLPLVPPIAGTALVLTGAIIGVLVLLRRELLLRAEAEQMAVAAQAESERLAATDALTGLWNRRRFEAMLALCADPTRRRDWALLIIDTDYFKTYNDCYGHPAGDRALERIADVLARATERFGGTAFRIGGEEFAVLAPCAEREALALADGIRESLAALRLPHAEHPRGFLTLSIGLAHGRRLADASPRDWFNSADEALYTAKRRGRDRTCLAVASRPADEAEAPAVRLVVSNS